MKFKVNNLGAYLKDARKSNSLTISSVAEDLSLSAGYISRIENGTSNPSFAVLNALCNKYKLNIRDIVDTEFLNKQNESLINLNIADIIMSDNITYYDKEISLIDKLNILKFIDFYVSCEDTEFKTHLMGLISKFKEWSEK